MPSSPSPPPSPCLITPAGKTLLMISDYPYLHIEIVSSFTSLLIFIILLYFSTFCFYTSFCLSPSPNKIFKNMSHVFCIFIAICWLLTWCQAYFTYSPYNCGINVHLREIWCPGDVLSLVCTPLKKIISMFMFMNSGISPSKKWIIGFSLKKSKDLATLGLSSHLTASLQLGSGWTLWARCSLCNWL